MDFIQFLQKILKDREFKCLGRMVMTVWLGNMSLWETMSPSLLGAEENVKTPALLFMFSSFLKPCSVKIPVSHLILKDPVEIVFSQIARRTVILQPHGWSATGLTDCRGEAGEGRCDDGCQLDGITSLSHVWVRSLIELSGTN